MTDREKPRLVILLSGRGSNYQAIAQAISDGWLPGQIAAVISDRSAAPGLTLAAEAGADTVCIERQQFADRLAFENALATVIDGFAPRYVVLAGFMRVLGADLVRRYQGRMINIHPSLLPRHRGLNTHQRVIEAGEREHGASVHFVTPALDAGPVISQVRMSVTEGDTPTGLAEKLLPLEHRLYPATLALLLTHPVELRDEEIYLDNQILRSPLLLGADLGDGGEFLGGRQHRP